MAAKKKKRSGFLVRYRETNLCETWIEAEDAGDARAKFERGDRDRGAQVIDTIDWEFVSVKADS